MSLKNTVGVQRSGQRLGQFEGARDMQVFSRLNDAVIRVYHGAGNVVETHEHTGGFKEW